MAGVGALFYFPVGWAGLGGRLGGGELGGGHAARRWRRVATCEGSLFPLGAAKNCQLPQNIVEKKNQKTEKKTLLNRPLSPLLALAHARIRPHNPNYQPPSHRGEGGARRGGGGRGRSAGSSYYYILLLLSNQKFPLLSAAFRGFTIYLKIQKK